MSQSSYKVKRGPDRLSFEQYALHVIGDFEALLSSEPSEKKVQKFLERHPSLVPGARTPSLSSGHFPLHCSLITQPELPGFHARVPDFLWIAADSGTWYPTLIEIERPTKKLFTKAGQPTSEFTQARTQLAQWRAWFQNPTNIHQFMELYGIPLDWRKNLSRRLHMILIYGRRAEFESDTELASLRSALMTGADEELVSFDRLMPDPILDLMITARAVAGGRFQAVWVPETFGTCAYLARRLLTIDGLGQAIDRNAAISKARKIFLKERIKYWQEIESPTGFSRASFTVE